MRRKFLVRALLLFAIFLSLFVIWIKFRYGGPVVPFPDATTSPPLLPASRLEVVATLNEAPGNIAVSADGRVFFTFPS